MMQWPKMQVVRQQKWNREEQRINVQCRTVRVFKVFSEYPGIFEKYFCLDKPLQIKIQHYYLLL